MNFFVLDLEFNQFFEFPHTTTTAEVQCPAEIIQIGIVKLDDELNICDSRSFFVRPQIYTKMHPHIEKITGITIEMLRDQPYFVDVFKEFHEYVGNTASVFCIWGPDDMKELYKNILYYKLNGNVITKNYINVQKLASKYLKNPNNSIGLKTAVETFNIQIERPFHDALNDALYTAEIFKIISNSEQITNLTNLNETPVQKIEINRLKQSILSKLDEVNLQPLYDYAQSKLKRKINQRDKEAILSIYNAGRINRFDILGKKKKKSQKHSGKTE